MEQIHSGWLTKSPPEKKFQKLFKQQWRKRFFVLSVEKLPASSSTSSSTQTVHLYYYDSDKNTHKKNHQKGYIDLTNCLAIQAQLDASFYEHVFSIETKHKGKSRTYYLAADSAIEMDNWIDCLCGVLQLDINQSAVVSSPESPFSPPSSSSRSLSPLVTSPAKRADVAVSMAMGSPVSFHYDFLPVVSPKNGSWNSVSPFDVPSPPSTRPRLTNIRSDSPPPTLPLKSVQHHCSNPFKFDADTPHGDLRGSQMHPAGDADSDRKRDSSHLSDYDIPPPRRDRITSDVIFYKNDVEDDYDVPPARRVQEKTTGAMNLVEPYPEVFEMEEDHKPASAAGERRCGPVRMTEQTRSFKRTIASPDQTIMESDDQDEYEGEGVLPRSEQFHHRFKD